MSDPEFLPGVAEFIAERSAELERDELELRQRVDEAKLGLVISSRNPLFSALREELAARPEFMARMHALGESS